MASRILHLAVADALLKEFDIDGPARFFLGSVLPDAKIDSRLRALPHYQTILPNGLITYKLKEFLSVYGSKMMDDSLYLGYYLHLIQDIFLPKIYVRPPQLGRKNLGKCAEAPQRLPKNKPLYH